MSSQLKTPLEILEETFNWTDTMQSIQEQPQGRPLTTDQYAELQVGPFEEFQVTFTSIELYDTFPSLSKESLKTLIQDYTYHHQYEILETILQWKEDQDIPYFQTPLEKMTNEKILEVCTNAENYRNYCDKTTEDIDDTWQTNSITGLLKALNKAEKDLKLVYYEIDRRCYHGTWLPE